MKMKRISLLILSPLFFATAFQSDKLITQGWYQQFFPNLNGSAINSITFLDSLTGYAVTSTNSSVQGYIIKTTNGGDNWSIIYTYVPPSVNTGFTVIQFANDSIGYAASNYFTFFKTTNAGLNWIQLTTPDGAEGMAVINKDTVLVVVSDGFAGGVYRTTNGGYNWQAMGQTGGTGQPKKIFMVNKDIGFVCQDFQTPRFRRTSNGGFNWIDMTESEFNDMTFIDSIVGWKINGTSIKKTTDGGQNWINQTLPASYSFYGNSIYALNKDTIWAVGGTYNLNGTLYGMIHKTTNGGINWGYQLTDTSVHIGRYFYINFVNKNCGWANSYTGGVHTKVGGNDTTYITSITNQISDIPTDYFLYQNYPNPFNPSTTIKYELKKSGFIRLKVFDINGKEISTLVSKKQNNGMYEVRFDASSLSSGAYFYQLSVNNEQITTKKMIVMK
jgi:photosystem II stability/assembly factor-like uncharacterized protein